MTNKIPYAPLSDVLSHVLQRNLTFTPESGRVVATVDVTTVLSYLVTNKMLKKEQIDSLHLKKLEEVEKYIPLYTIMVMATFDQDMQQLHHIRRDVEIVLNYLLSNKVMTEGEVKKFDRLMKENLEGILEEEEIMNIYPWEC